MGGCPSATWPNAPNSKVSILQLGQTPSGIPSTRENVSMSVRRVWCLWGFLGVANVQAAAEPGSKSQLCRHVALRGSRLLCCSLLVCLSPLHTEAMRGCACSPQNTVRPRKHLLNTAVIILFFHSASNPWEPLPMTKTPSRWQPHGETDSPTLPPRSSRSHGGGRHSSSSQTASQNHRSDGRCKVQIPVMYVVYWGSFYKSKSLKIGKMLFKKHGKTSMAHGSVKKASRRTIGVGRSTAGAYEQLARGVSPVLT